MVLAVSGLVITGVVVALAVALLLHLFRQEDIDRAEERRESERQG